MALELPTCAVCGLRAFPAQLRCARCGAVRWTTTTVQRGELEAVTTVERSLVASTGSHPRVGCVRLADGVRVIVRVAGAPATGDTVTLSADGDVVVASPA